MHLTHSNPLNTPPELSQRPKKSLKQDSGVEVWPFRPRIGRSHPSTLRRLMLILSKGSLRLSLQQWNCGFVPGGRWNSQESSWEDKWNIIKAVHMLFEISFHKKIKGQIPRTHHKANSVLVKNHSSLFLPQALTTTLDVFCMQISQLNKSTKTDMKPGLCNLTKIL